MPTVDFTPANATKARQCAAILLALSQAPLTTIEARERLGIQSPAARVLDLRKQGYAIVTHTRKAFDAEGRPHRCAAYVLNEGVAA